MGSGLAKSIKYNSAIHGSSWGLPPQMVAQSIKETEEWQQACMDFFDYRSARGNDERYRDNRKLDYLQGNIDKAKYQVNAYNLLGMSKPEVKVGEPQGSNNPLNEGFTHYPIMIRPFNTIIGEYIKRIAQLHGFYVKNESDYARNEHNRVKEEMLQNYATQQIMTRVNAKVKAMGLKPGTDQFNQQVQQQTPEDIQDFMDRDYVDIVETVNQTILKNMWKTESLDDEFIDGFKSLCSINKEFYHIYSVNNKTRIKNIDSADVFYEKSKNDRWVSSGQYAGFRTWYTPSGVIDMFYDSLTIEDFQEIEAAVNPNVKKDNKAGKTGWQSITYDTDTFADYHGNLHGYLDDAYDMIRDYQRYGPNSNFSRQNGLIKVVRAYWKSYRMVGWLTSYDANDEEIIEMVDDNYEPDVNKGEEVKWFPQVQVYTGAKILNGIYKDIKPYNDQIVDMDNLEYNPLPIEGWDGGGNSLFDLMLPWNEMYDIVAAELKEDINASIGKAMFMSTDHIPNIPGFTMEKWYYWVKKFKIAWVKAPKSGPNTFNQFSAVDMSFAQQMLAKMEILTQIMNNCDSFAGFVPGRIAGQSSDQTLGQSNQQISASVNQTEYLFFKHSKLIQRVLNQALGLARKSLKQNTFIRNLFDDYQQAFIDYDPEMLSNAKVGLYTTNSSEDLRKRQQMESLMQPAMQNGADFTDMSELIMAETISEIRTLGHKLRRNTKANLQAQQQLEKDKVAQEQANFEEKMKTMKDIATDKNKSAENQAYIKTFGGKNASPEDDANNDTIPDVLEFEEFNLKQQDLFAKHRFADRKQVFEEKKHKDQMTMENKKLTAEKARTAAIKRKPGS